MRGRDQDAAPEGADDGDLRHPRPDRGDDAGRPDRGDERRPDRAAWHAARALPHAGQPVRGGLHRLAGDELPARPRSTAGWCGWTGRTWCWRWPDRLVLAEGGAGGGGAAAGAPAAGGAGPCRNRGAGRAHRVADPPARRLRRAAASSTVLEGMALLAAGRPDHPRRPAGERPRLRRERRGRRAAMRQGEKNTGSSVAPTALRLLEPPRRKVRAVLDTDTYNEIDDQFAIVQTLLSPEQHRPARRSTPRRSTTAAPTARSTAWS